MPPLIACVDVDYRDSGAVAACVACLDFGDDAPALERIVRIAEVEPYEPGSFYRRELPCLLAVLASIGEPIRDHVSTIVVDGYVFLGEDGRPGLGARLHEALEAAVPVIGVAKAPFRGTVGAVPVLRGDSKKPLHVSAAGIDVEAAAGAIRRMHGEHRIPTLLKRVDRLCRDAPEA